jgi:hypothetical protein
MRHRSSIRRLTGPAVLSVAALALVACGGGDDDGDDDAAAPPAEQQDVAGDGTEAPDANDGGGSPSATEAPAGTDAPPATDAPAGGGGAGAGFAPAGTGFIEIGDLRHELTVTGCVNLFGAIGGNAESVTEPDNVEVNFDFSPEDWQERAASEGWEENGAITLRSEEPYLQWETGVSALELYNLPAGTDAAALDITSFDIDDAGQSVQGEAVFLDIVTIITGGAAEPTPGTFAFSCPED